MATQEELKKRYFEKRKWYTERIGKRVFRDSNGCSCKICKRIEEEGLIITDKDHAAYLQDSAAEGGYEYRDSK